MRHYSLKNIVINAEDVERAGVSGEPDQGNASGQEHSEEPTKEPSDNDDIKTAVTDEKRTLEGQYVDIKRDQSDV